VSDYRRRPTRPGSLEVRVHASRSQEQEGPSCQGHKRMSKNEHMQQSFNVNESHLRTNGIELSCNKPKISNNFGILTCHEVEVHEVVYAKLLELQHDRTKV